MLIFELHGGEQRLIFTNSVLSFFYRYRQINGRQPESGGQLFAKITQRTIIVAVATGPHWRDLRHRFSFFPNKKRLSDEIKDYFLKGLHYVGDWHTHPQKFPKPSLIDIRTMKSCFALSHHELKYFILAVVGHSIGPKGIWVGLLNDSEIVGLS